MEKEIINMAEIYNPELDQWELITARMSTPRVGLCMVSMGNMIYVMGKGSFVLLVGSWGKEGEVRIKCITHYKQYLECRVMPCLPSFYARIFSHSRWFKWL